MNEKGSKAKGKQCSAKLRWSAISIVQRRLENKLTTKAQCLTSIMQLPLSSILAMGHNPKGGGSVEVTSDQDYALLHKDI